MKFGYFGPRGTFTEAALGLIESAKDAQHLPFESVACKPFLPPAVSCLLC